MNKPNHNGFTIIELLMVMTIVSVLFIGIMTTYVQIQKLLSDQSESSYRGREVEELYRTLNQDISNLVFEPWNQKYFFTAEKEFVNGQRIDFLNFISGTIYSNPSILQSRVRNVTYFGQVNSKTGKTVLYRKEDMLADFNKKTLGVPVPVMENITEFRAEFSMTGNDWVDKWDVIQTKNLPRFIKVTISYEQSSDQSSPQRTIVLETTPGILL